jgi:hypothetical protein
MPHSRREQIPSYAGASGAVRRGVPVGLGRVFDSSEIGADLRVDRGFARDENQVAALVYVYCSYTTLLRGRAPGWQCGDVLRAPFRRAVCTVLWGMRLLEAGAQPISGPGRAKGAPRRVPRGVPLLAVALPLAERLEGEEFPTKGRLHYAAAKLRGSGTRACARTWRGPAYGHGQGRQTGHE